MDARAPRCCGRSAYASARRRFLEELAVARERETERSLTENASPDRTELARIERVAVSGVLA
jgi:hypothetical protein